MSSPFTKRARRALPALVAVSVLLGLYGGPAHAAAVDPFPNRVLVVTANLQEAYGNSDVGDHQDMAIFVDRLVAQAPFAPDVLLLQEVRHSSAQWVAQRLGARTGSPYSVKVDPGEMPTNRDGSFTRFRDTAILFNDATMAATSAGSYYATRPNWSEVPAGLKPSWHEHAFLGGGEVSSGMILSFASTHVAPSSTLKSSVAASVRNRWTTGLSNYMANNYPGTALSSIAGDFNSSRCVSGGGDNCALSPFWATITNNQLYRDGVRSVMEHGGVDFVFSKAGVYQAGVDDTYSPDGASGDATQFYSDHRFRWTVLGPDTIGPSAPAAPDLRDRRPDVGLSWSPATDQGDSGLLRYEVWRSGKVGKFRLVASLPPSQTTYLDQETFHTLGYRYYLVAVDGAHNRSSPSPTSNITI
ncbi:hypothetical protein BH18ACT15_BH18ACT15_05910 [soil metagenome]